MSKTKQTEHKDSKELKDQIKQELEKVEFRKITLKDVFKRFSHYYKDYKIKAFLVVFGMLCASGGTAATAWAIEPILDKIFMERNVGLLYTLPFLVVLIYAIKNFGLFLQSYYMAYIGSDITRKLLLDMFKNILKQDLSYFHKKPAGELISRCTGDIGAVSNILVGFVPNFARELISAVGLIAVVIYQSPKLAFFAFVVVPVAFFPIRILAKKLQKVGVKSQQKGATRTSKLNEAFLNIELIKSSNSKELEEQKFSRINDEIFALGMTGAKLDNFLSPLMETCGSLGISLVIMIGGYEVVNGDLTTGSFFSFLTALFMAYTPVRRLSNIYSSVQTSLAGCSRVFEVLDSNPQITDGGKDIKDIENIEFKNADLVYDDGTKALENINLKMQKNETIALVGLSGGGKTSLINLISRFYDVSSGELLINDSNIKDLNINPLRDQISLVTQNTYLLNDTIANNVAYARKYDEARVIQALKDANAYEFVSKLDNGIHTMLAERGSNLSGGQRQRIAIARALYKDPSVIIFDEATSALDNKSESVITDLIGNIKQGKIIILIAHRLSTIKSADKIAVMEHGKIIGFGSDEELLQTCELYKELKTKSKF